MSAWGVEVSELLCVCGMAGQRDWATLGPRLSGKVQLFVGSSDTFYLSNAVMDAQVGSRDSRGPTRLVW